MSLSLANIFLVKDGQALFNRASKSILVFAIIITYPFYIILHEHKKTPPKKDEVIVVPP